MWQEPHWEIQIWLWWAEYPEAVRQGIQVKEKGGHTNPLAFVLFSESLSCSYPYMFVCLVYLFVCWKLGVGKIGYNKLCSTGNAASWLYNEEYFTLQRWKSKWSSAVTCTLLTYLIQCLKSECPARFGPKSVGQITLWIKFDSVEQPGLLALLDPPVIVLSPHATYSGRLADVA